MADPLANVPVEVVREARRVVAEAAAWNVVDPEMADPIADSVVLSLVRAGHILTGRVVEPEPEQVDRKVLADWFLGRRLIEGGLLGEALADEIADALLGDFTVVHRG